VEGEQVTLQCECAAK